MRDAAAAGSLGRTDIARWLGSGRRDIATAEWSVVWWGGTAGAAGCGTRRHYLAWRRRLDDKNTDINDLLKSNFNIINALQ